ncbi:alpha/beta-hydrolase [Phellopilus nigrolimitatus]|nr:alpha/beta-hydrolase [Phellopilus nigrolimitatus]
MVRCPPSPPSDPSMPPTSQHRASSPDTLDGQSNLLTALHALHADEFTYLGQKLSGYERKYAESRIFRTYAMVKQYVLFMLKTWVKAAWAFVFFPTTLMDRIAIVLLSAAACAVMSVLLPWCLLCNIPLMRDLFDRFSRRVCNGLSIVNASYPTIFEELSNEQIATARKHLSQPIEESSNKSNRRVFNLDAAKLLLQCAALMYERTSRTTRRAASVAASHSFHPHRHPTDLGFTETPPGSHITDLCGITGAQAVTAELHGASAEENTICSIARDKLGLSYSTVSELNNTGSAFCGLFWDPQDTFVIVAFKGTTPADFKEWTGDFTFQMREAGLWLRGFGRVHDGFMDKVFPRRIPPGSRMPYTTIIEAIRKVAECLAEQSPGKPINVWITGHSLGCALASLVYSRLINEPRECGEDTVIRDAYLFAAPVVCDVESANAFNNRMNHFTECPRTMWRVTNGKDAVATSLPDEGDNSEWLLSPWNLFSFAHLGCEVKLRGAPERCQVSGTHITPGTHVVVASAFHLDALPDQNTPLRRTLRALQDLPLLGRLLAHGTGFYWVALQEVGAGTCEWVFE